MGKRSEVAGFSVSVYDGGDFMIIKHKGTFSDITLYDHTHSGGELQFEVDDHTEEAAITAPRADFVELFRFLADHFAKKEGA